MQRAKDDLIQTVRVSIPTINDDVSRRAPGDLALQQSTLRQHQIVLHNLNHDKVNGDS